MGFGQWTACNATPLLLRLGLAAVFIWAGYGKLAYNDPMKGEDAAILANLGVVKMATATPAPPAPAEAPAEPPPAEEKPKEDSPPQTRDRGVAVVLPALAAEPTPATMEPTRAAFTAEDFPTPVMVGRVHHITLMLHRAAHPADPAKQLWPAQLAGTETIILLAWTAVIVEVLGGALVLFGFLTRVAAIGLAGVMVVAMLLTTIGPAAISGDGFLGFLPQPRMADSQAWGQAWQSVLFQWSMLMMSLGVVLSGAGGLSLDRLIFGGRRGKAAAAKSAPSS